MKAQPEEFMITFGPAKLSPEDEKLFQAIVSRWRIEERERYPDGHLYRRIN